MLSKRQGEGLFDFTCAKGELTCLKVFMPSHSCTYRLCCWRAYNMEPSFCVGLMRLIVTHAKQGGML